MRSSTFGCAETPQSDGNAPSQSCLAEGVAGVRVDAVEVAALVEAGERDAAVHDDVGADDASFISVRAPQPSSRLASCDGLGDARPQRAARLVLGDEAVGADEPVAVERLAVAEADDVDHAVAVERVVDLQRRVQRVLGVAQVDAVEVGRDLALDDREVVGVPLGGLRAPRAGAVRVVVVLGQRGQELADDLRIVGCRLISAMPSRGADDEADRGGGAAAEVERAERPCARRPGSRRRCR